MNKNIYSVKDITKVIKGLFAHEELMNKVSVRGEISNLKDHSSGHLYFTLKDDGAVLKGVMFRGNRMTGLKAPIREGEQVVVTGEISVYEMGGNYQIYARTIEKEGQGDLYRQFEELKKRLEEEGLFSQMYKKPLPKYARTVGIVTAATGAALQDIINIATRRNPYVQLILSPALVQGTDAPASIVSAIRAMDAFGPDIMIVGRGGGSIEDLWAFNDERVARAVFDANTPVISAVGHEVDFTITDFVADHRAPTPSAAAELAVFDYKQFLLDLNGYENGLFSAMRSNIVSLKNQLKSAEARLKDCHPVERLKNHENQLNQLTQRFHQAMNYRFQAYRNRLSLLEAKLNGLSPLAKLTGGYGYIEKDGGPLKEASALKTGDALSITLHDGIVDATVTGVREIEGRN